MSIRARISHISYRAFNPRLQFKGSGAPHKLTWTSQKGKYEYSCFVKRRCRCHSTAVKRQNAPFSLNSQGSARRSFLSLRCRYDSYFCTFSSRVRISFKNSARSQNRRSDLVSASETASPLMLPRQRPRQGHVRATVVQE